METQLSTIAQGAALMRVGDGSVTLAQGQSAKQSDVVAKLTSMSDTQALVTFTKA